MKRILFALVTLMFPVLLMAQTAGGYVKRPVKKPTTTTPAKKQPVAMTTEQKRIVQQILDNMVYVEGGTFTMGADIEGKHKSYKFYVEHFKAHQVTLSSYSIGKYEVTQEEWKAIMGSNPSHFKGGSHPVENVSWNDCQRFIRKLNQLSGKKFRLPTEAEWEYAARGGKQSKGYVFAGSDNYVEVAWYMPERGELGTKEWDESNPDYGTHPVGQKKANELGLYDMSGNVYEWCYDLCKWSLNLEYTEQPQSNPKGETSGDRRVQRGGCYGSPYYDCLTVRREINYPDNGNQYYGFRLVM